MAGQRQLDILVAYVAKGLQNGDPAIIGIVVALLVVFSTIVIFMLKNRSGNNRQGILLMGVCDSGKTLMFCRLVYGRFKQTVTSISVNRGDIKLPDVNKTLRVIDVPGHERLRTQMLDENKALARGIVFVVDSTTIVKEVKEVADFLYTILSDRVIQNNRPPVLVACNKQDQTLCKGAPVIQKMLEKEMELVRKTKSAALQSLDSNSNNNNFIGQRSKPFLFADLKPLVVDFVECSTRGKEEGSEGDLKSVKDWMLRIA